VLAALDEALDLQLDELGEEVRKVLTRRTELSAAFTQSELAAKPPVEKINGAMLTVGPHG